MTKKSPEEHIKYVLFAEAVKRAKAAIARRDKSETRMCWIIGEMAYRLKPGPYTINRFADSIGFSRYTVNNYRFTYKVWHKMPQMREMDFNALRTLNRHPDREEIMKENPKLSRKKAVMLARRFSRKRSLAGRPSSGNYRTTSQFASDMIRSSDRFLEADGIFQHSFAMVRQNLGDLTDNMRQDLHAMAMRHLKVMEEVNSICKVISFARKRKAYARRAKATKGDAA